MKRVFNWKHFSWNLVYFLREPNGTPIFYFQPKLHGYHQQILYHNSMTPMSLSKPFCPIRFKTMLMTAVDSDVAADTAKCDFGMGWNTSSIEDRSRIDTSNHSLSKGHCTHDKYCQTSGVRMYSDMGGRVCPIIGPIEFCKYLDLVKLLISRSRYTSRAILWT